MKNGLKALIFSGLSLSCFAEAKDIIHDAEYNFIKAQHSEKWAK